MYQNIKYIGVHVQSKVVGQKCVILGSVFLKKSFGQQSLVLQKRIGYPLSDAKEMYNKSLPLL